MTKYQVTEPPIWHKYTSLVNFKLYSTKNKKIFCINTLLCTEFGEPLQCQNGKYTRAENAGNGIYHNWKIEQNNFKTRVGSRILDIPQKFYEFEQVFPLNSVLVSGFSYIQTLKTSKFIFTSPCIIKMLLYRWGATLLARCMVQWNRKIALENLNKQISENKNEVFVSCPFKEELFFSSYIGKDSFHSFSSFSLGHYWLG